MITSSTQSQSPIILVLLYSCIDFWRDVLRVLIPVMRYIRILFLHLTFFCWRLLELHLFKIFCFVVILVVTLNVCITAEPLF